MPSVSSSRPADTEPGRRGGATQLTPKPGTNGRMNERDNQRALRIVVALVVALVVGVLAFNFLYMPDGASTREGAVQIAPSSAAGANPSQPPAR